jgi:hypothetical protein
MQQRQTRLASVRVRGVASARRRPESNPEPGLSMRTIESAPPVRLAAMSSKFPDPPSEAVFAAVVAQAELDVAHAKPKGREPKTVKVQGGFRLKGVTWWRSWRRTRWSRFGHWIGVRRSVRLNVDRMRAFICWIFFHGYVNVYQLSKPPRTVRT